MNIFLKLKNSFPTKVIIYIGVIFLLISCKEDKNYESEIKFRSAWEKYSKLNFDEAIQELNQLIESDPHFAARAYNLRGHCKLLGDYDLHGAIEDYDKAINLKPDFADAYLNRGVAYHLLKNFGAALNNFDKCIMYAPRFAEGYKERALTKRSLGDFEGAIEDYNILLTIEPSNCEAWASRGYVKYKLGDLSGACKDLTLAEKNGCYYYSDLRKKSCNN